MLRRSALLLTLLAGLLVRPAPAAEAPPPDPGPDTPLRVLHVPFDDLNVILRDQPKRVLLAREDYEALVAKARRDAITHPPRDTAVVAADYQLTITGGRTTIAGRLTVDVLEPGVRAVPLDLAGVAIRRAVLGDQDAAIGQADGGLTLFVQGKGRHQLDLDMLSVLHTSAAHQMLNLRLPSPAATTMALTVPGDVEVKSGAAVIERTFDAAAEATRFRLLGPRGDLHLVMSLNSRLMQAERLVLARSVLVDEITAGYERLHATMSLAIPHRPVDSFRFVVPRGFEITRVGSPLVARWAVDESDAGRVLEVRLRQATSETVVLNLSAERAGPTAADWSLPLIQPLDVAGHVSVVGLLVEDRLKVRSIEPTNLIPLDTAVLLSALPASVLEARPGAPRLRPVVAYYAPAGDFALRAAFDEPAKAVKVTSNVLLLLRDPKLEAHGGFALQPEGEKLFTIDLAVPAGWQLTEVTDGDGARLGFERYPEADQAGRARVTLARAVEVGGEYRVFFKAAATPDGWLDDWADYRLDFPLFRVLDAADDVGALAVAAGDDMQAQPLTIDGLTPLDDKEKDKYGLADVPTDLVYRYDAQQRALAIGVGRIDPRLTARTFSCFRIEPDALAAHYEVLYDVTDARVRKLALSLPADTPDTLSIRGLDDVTVKEFTSQEVDGRRRWVALLSDRRSGRVRLAVDFEKRLTSGSDDKPLPIDLPIVTAEDVAYQSGLVSVEGSAELDVKQIDPDQGEKQARKVDVGELIDATYQPGNRLLGVWAFVGQPAAMRFSATRPPRHAMPPALVERAELTTLLSAQGVAQTEAFFDLKTKAAYLELRLPDGATLWSALLDGQPSKPRRSGSSMLISLPPTDEPVTRRLTVVYESPVTAIGFWDDLNVPAPSLMLPADGATASADRRPIPIADLQWTVNLPEGYAAVGSGGSVVTDDIQRPALAAARVAGWLYKCTGKMKGPICLLPSLGRVRKSAQMVGQEYDSWEGEMPDAAATDDVTAGSRVIRREVRGRIRRSPAGRPAGQVGPAPAETAPPPSTPPTGLIGLAKPPSVHKLLGTRSLTIALEQVGQPVHFRSLGEQPLVELTLVKVNRLDALSWGLALLVGLVGLTLTRRPVARKLRFLIIVALIATLLPLLTRSVVLASALNGAFYAVCLLAGWYLLAASVTWVAKKLKPRPIAPAATAAVSLLLVLLAGSQIAAAPKPDQPYVIQVMPPEQPITVPADALIAPYDPNAVGPLGKADKLLVPYDRYVELWNQAYPDKPIGQVKPPAPYALAGAAFTATLRDDEVLVVTGRLNVEVYADGYVTVPLPLAGGVLAKALLDGEPAKLSVVRVDQVMIAQQQAARQRPNTPDLMALHVTGEGRHQLDLAVHLTVNRQGGWRIVNARLPVAPAAALTLTVPQTGTQLLLGQVADQAERETADPDQQIQTALGAAGRLDLRWRAKIDQAQVDQGLTADSTATLDVQEDGLRVVWQVALGFRGEEQRGFGLSLPGDYVIEKVVGANVRGWTATDENGRQQLDVTLLKPVRTSESFTVHMWRPGTLGAEAEAQLAAPVVDVTGARMHHGTITIRRSRLLDLRTVSVDHASRTDLPAAAETMRSADSPLGLRPYQAYRFVATPFDIRLAARTLKPRVSASLQSILRIAQRQRNLETRVLLNVQDREIHRVEMLLSSDVKLEQVTAPGRYEWAVTGQDDQQRLTVYLASGQSGSVPVVLTATLAAGPDDQRVALPRVEVLNVDRQSGQMVVQTDPAFRAHTEGLVNCSDDPHLEHAFGWLDRRQRSLARLIVTHHRPDYSGSLVLTAREPTVRCTTVTNVRVTDRAVEETILLDFDIVEAGVREVSFLLPARMTDARVSVPLLRRKTVTPVSDEPDAPVRVTCHLQDAVLGQLRVLVENDRLLTAEAQTAPIPTVQTGSTTARFVVLESAGRDEVTETAQDLERLTRKQKAWQRLAQLLKGGSAQAYLVSGDNPQLSFTLKQREAVRTAQATIFLAQTLLVLDAHGAYRASQSYEVDNSVEQFLEVELPAGAELWTASVAGEPVKPARVPGGTANQVRLPLVKTAAGELPYQVMIKYGGRMPSIGGLGTVSFPLARTVNIGVQQSVVRLFLPETYSWFDFDGTMRLVTDEGDLSADYLASRNAIARRLIETAGSSDELTRARSASNLSQWGLGNDAYVNYLGRQGYGGNKKLRKQLDTNAYVVQQAREQIGQIQKEQGAAVGAFDNRHRLNQSFGGQRNVRAYNVVQDLPSNFDGPVSDRGDKTTGESVNEWFGSVKLKSEAVPTDQPAAHGEALQTRVGWKDGKESGGKGAQAGQGRQLQLKSRELDAWNKKLSKSQAPRQEESQLQRAQRYQTQLEVNQQGSAGGQAGQREETVYVSDIEVTGSGQRAGREQVIVPAATIPSAGLVSLDVQIPTRGVEYVFTTPRGDVEITARSASDRLLTTGKQLGWVLLAVVVLGGLYLLIRQLPTLARRRPETLPVMIALGLLSAILGVLPIVGLALLLIALTWMVYNRRRRTA